MNKESYDVPIYTIEIDGREIEYIKIKDINSKYKNEFEGWMIGQTRPLVTDDMDEVYLWDWERWIEWKLGKIDDSIFD